MIVNVSAWLYVVGAILMLFGVTGLATLAQRAVALLHVALLVSVAVGLLMRRNWARWLTLGMSFLTWTLGSLGVLYIGYVFANLPAAVRGSSRTMFILVTLLLFVAALIWLSFRLYKHLTSDAGREEFGTPETEKNAVATSVVVSLVWSAFNSYMIPPAVIGPDDFSKRRAADPEQATTEGARESSEATLEARALERAARERGADVAREQARTPARQGTIEDERGASTVRKCRDSSGAVSFTELYCRRGTSEFDKPSAD